MASDHNGTQRMASDDIDMPDASGTTPMQKMPILRYISLDETVKQKIWSNYTVKENTIEADIRTENIDTTFSFEDFQVLRKRCLQQLSGNTRQHFCRQISSFFSDPQGPYNYDASTANETADNWLDPNATVSENAECDSSDDDETSEQLAVPKEKRKAVL